MKRKYYFCFLDLFLKTSGLKALLLKGLLRSMNCSGSLFRLRMACLRSSGSGNSGSSFSVASCLEEQLWDDVLAELGVGE